MYEISYGPRYEQSKHLGTKEIAALFRQDVKRAIACGDLPKGLRLSVRIERFSGGSSINVTVKAVPFPLLNPEALRFENERPHTYHTLPRYTSLATLLLAKLKAMVDAYNYDGSEIQVDYFHVRYYSHVSIAWEAEKAEKEAFLVVPEKRS